MVHRLSLAVLCFVPLAGLCEPTVYQHDKDLIRERAQMDIMRTPADTNIEPDSSLARALFRGSRATTDPLAVALPKLQLLSGGQVFAGEALALIASTIGYSISSVATVNLHRPISVPANISTADALLAAVEKEGHLRATLYPNARLLVVTDAKHGR